MKVFSNYYIGSFFWSTLAKIISAAVGFISIPLLLGVYGKANYGVLALATSCNGYMHLLDLGMNTGAVKFFSQWKTEGKKGLINSVAHTNISFYVIIASINALLLLFLAFFGEGLFSLTHEQFVLLQNCLIIIALLSVLSWTGTAFTQLLIADNKIAYTHQVNCVIHVLKLLLVLSVLYLKISLIIYFFVLTFLTAFVTFPYARKCKIDGLIDSFSLGNNWKDFKIVIFYSLSIFALSVFQMTASQSRPIILGIFCENGAEVVSDFRIIEVIPAFMISIGLSFSGIFLPKASGIWARHNIKEIRNFAYHWTFRTSVLSCCLCFPLILCAYEILLIYVGEEYTHLTKWLIIWILTALIQIHTTPGNSLILSSGETKPLVITSAVSCFISIIINIFLCKYLNYESGSAVIGYLIYVFLVISMNYLFFYKKILGLGQKEMILSFINPVLLGGISFIVISVLLPNNVFSNLIESYPFLRYFICFFKSIIWGVLFFFLLLKTKLIALKEIKSLFSFK